MPVRPVFVVELRKAEMELSGGIRLRSCERRADAADHTHRQVLVQNMLSFLFLSLCTSNPA